MAEKKKKKEEAEVKIEYKEVKLRPKVAFTVPIEAECIKPDTFAGKSLDDIAKLPVYEGNTRRTLGDLFEIEGSPGSAALDTMITIEGDLSKVKRIGEGMTAGKIVIKGDVGHYLGFKMKGGSIEVHGNVGLWLGGKMKGGEIVVFGNAGDCVGGALRGELPGKGMKKGTIIIHGNAGAEVGKGMSGGSIIVDGNVGPLPGVDMRGGNIGIKGDCEGKPGARMAGGRVVIVGKVPSVLPSFYIDDVRETIKTGPEKLAGPFYVFIGDVLADIKCGGRLFVSIPSNPHLKPLETFLTSVADEEV
ncbi:MAG: formylmethanofuran dehydrogenase subunit C [Thermoprotei archaeon]|nr:MAG: formylmethanofuran dehydrogenase subunit C [Thermoprotei archaeon]RLF14305.1 MAG: formylmethanofuran dehydrogenase subunit C [Thermoprotei archaeon]